MSALTVADLRRVQPGVLEEVASGLRREQGRVLEVTAVLLVTRVARISWVGAAADAASARHLALSNRLGGFVRRLGACVDVLESTAPRLRSALALLFRAGHRAEEEGAWVDEWGAVRVLPRVADPDVVAAAVQARSEAVMRAEVEAMVRRAQTMARDADDALARSLVAAARGVTGTGLSTAGTVPPPPALSGALTPFATAAWWSSLSPEQRRKVLGAHPDWVGPRDGIPAADRHTANLVLLGRLEQQARTRYDEANDGWRVALHRGEIDAASDRLADLQAVRDVLGRHDGGPRTLLMIDGSGELLEAAVAVGDIDRADHVATYVGGLSTTVRGDLRRYDSTLSRMRAQAGRVGGSDADQLAIVTWLGYPAPQNTSVVGVPGASVFGSSRAQSYAAELAAFTNGVAASRDRYVHQTVWAHSYGSVLAGFALLQPHSIDDVVVFGSPGLPFHSIDQAGLKRGGLNVLRADLDPVATVGPVVHQVEAENVAGSIWLSTAASKDAVNTWRPSSGHGGYLDAGSTSERNLVAVALARPDRTVQASPKERSSHVSAGRIVSWVTAVNGEQVWRFPFGAPVR
ncbi:MAG: alpha/beta hydrolase family protein [Humibacillus sp.]|nr:alpha/beta hydrolase family protein [Humibacillus sp.]MDN5776451.1 alpha/beta hydrolase family protein [Humibacillus sp.]